MPRVTGYRYRVRAEHSRPHGEERCSLQRVSNHAAGAAPSFETPTQVGRIDLGGLLRTRQSETAAIFWRSSYLARRQMESALVPVEVLGFENRTSSAEIDTMVRLPSVPLKPANVLPSKRTVRTLSASLTE